MKILHISSATSWRGGEQQISYLVSELNKLGVSSIIACPQESPLSQIMKASNFTVYEYAKRNLDPRIANLLKHICINENVDLIHLHDSHSHTYGVMSSTLFGNKVPLILSRRVDFPIGRSMASRWKYNHNSIVKILCVSRAIKNILAQEVKDTGKLAVVYSGIDLERIKSASGILRNQYGIKSNRLLIGNIASIAPHKDYFTYVDTIHSLKDLWTVHPFPKFMIIGGDGGEEAKIKKYLLSKGLENDIILTGFRSDISSIVAELDLMIVTSKEEGLCTSILDAFIARVPVVATAAGGIPELVLHLQTGLLAPVKDHRKLAYWIHKCLSENNLKERIIHKAALHAESFSKENLAKETLRHYSSSLK